MADSTLLASLVLGYVDDLRDRLAPMAVGVAWRVAGRAPRSRAPRAGPFQMFNLTMWAKPWCLLVHAEASLSVVSISLFKCTCTNPAACLHSPPGSTRRLGLPDAHSEIVYPPQVIPTWHLEGTQNKRERSKGRGSGPPSLCPPPWRANSPTRASSPCSSARGMDRQILRKISVNVF